MDFVVDFGMDVIVMDLYKLCGILCDFVDGWE